jgi:hypothetical protein
LEEAGGGAGGEAVEGWGEGVAGEAAEEGFEGEGQNEEGDTRKGVPIR